MSDFAQPEPRAEGIHIEFEVEGDPEAGRLGLTLTGPGPYRIVLSKDGWKVFQSSGEAQDVGPIVLPSDAWFYIAGDALDSHETAGDYRD